MKPRLFICGDSWADWPYPTKPYHWIHYLEYHFDVKLMAQRGCSNYDIFSQIGNIPKYKKGDRVVIIWTSPERIWDGIQYNDDDFTKELKKVSDVTIKRDKDLEDAINLLKIKRHSLWTDYNDNFFDGEVNFIKKVKIKMLKNYNQFFYTWNEDFWNRTKDFVKLLVEISTLSDKDADVYKNYDFSEDHHHGIDGCYKIYCIIKEDLIKNTEPTKCKINNLI